MRDDAPEKVSRLADGYNRTARDFDHAIHLAGLDGLQLFLVQRARVASWTSSQIDGTNKPKPFKLNLSALASSLERKVRTNLSAKHASLVASGIFIRLEDGSHLINKDYRKWVRPDGSSLLTDKQIAEAMSMRRKGRTVAPKRHQVSSNDDSPLQPGSPDRRYLATPSVAPKRHPLSLPSDSPLQPEPGHKPNHDKEVASKNGVASIGTRAESFLERERDAAAATHAREGLPDSDLFPIHDGPHSPTEAEALETLRLTRSLLPGNSIPEEVWQSQRLASPAVWRAAIREAARAQPSGVRMFRYVLAIASRFEADGVPTVKLPTVARNGQAAPAPRPSRREQFEARLGPFDSFLNPEAGDDH